MKSKRDDTKPQPLGEWPKNANAGPRQPVYDFPDCGCISSSPTHVCKSPRLRRSK